MVTGSYDHNTGIVNVDKASLDAHLKAMHPEIDRQVARDKEFTEKFCEAANSEDGITSLGQLFDLMGL